MTKEVVNKPRVCLLRVNGEFHLALRNDVSWKARIRRDQSNLTKRSSLREDEVARKGVIRFESIRFCFAHEYKIAFGKWAILWQIDTADNRNTFLDIISR